ncbi:MAG TPA: TIGR03118 family protein [Rhizomicrobium sp.]|nr:TIGR03118 family protein [Rhizomicrobium sp.]
MRTISSHRNWALVSGAAALLLSGAPAFAGIVQTNLVSDIPGLAVVTDPALVNPWGMTSSTTSPWWISDNGAGVSTLYNGNTGAKSALAPTIPPELGGTPPSAPTGVVFNSTTGFILSNGTKASFLFSTENGTIAGWNSAAGTTAIGMADLSSQDSVFKGLAIGSVGSANYLYATDFANGAVHVFNTTFGTATLGGNFTDPGLPSGYAPFGIQNLGGKLYVTYAEQGSGGNEAHGLGLGYVDVFDTNGNFLSRVASGGTLDAPWGLAIAPSSFMDYGNDLLVGNFGDGRINAYDPTSFAYLGQLLDSHGNPISIDGLWGLGFGNGASGGPTNTLFFTAGLDEENHGLFGALTSVPEPATWAMFLVGFGAIGFAMRRGKSSRTA